MNKFVDDSLIRLKSKNYQEPIQSGRFKIYLPEIYGFCGGVNLALKKLNKELNNRTSQKIHLLGEIIHNPTVNRHFEDNGVNIVSENEINKIFDIAAKEDTIVIPAFGIPLDLEINIQKYFNKIIDTTCGNVKVIWKFISKESEKDSTILLYGKPGHPEVKASISRGVANSSVIVIPDVESTIKFVSLLNTELPDILRSASGETTCTIDDIVIHNPDSFNPDRFALANQTTMLFNETVEMRNILKEAMELNSRDFIACDTICTATYLRQKAAVKVCQQNPDMIIVVGGYDSSNTAHLYTIGQNFCKTFYIKDSNSINTDSVTYFQPSENVEKNIKTSVLFENVKNITLLAGASCPFSVIGDLIEKLESV